MGLSKDDEQNEAGPASTFSDFVFRAFEFTFKLLAVLGGIWLGIYLLIHGDGHGGPY